MKMRSIAILAAVVAVSIGALSAKLLDRPTEGELGGGPGDTGVVNPRPISPSISGAAGTGTVPSASTMPMAVAPGMTRMPSMTPGMPYGQPATIGQVAALEGVKTVESLANIGAGIGKVYAEGDADTKRLQNVSRIKIDEARELAAIEKAKKDEEVARQLEVAKLDRAEKDAKVKKIEDGTKEARVTAQTGINNASKHIASLKSLIDQAGKKRDVTDLRARLDAIKTKLDDAKAAQVKAINEYIDALDKFDDKKIALINLALLNDVANPVLDIEEDIKTLNSEIRSPSK